MQTTSDLPRKVVRLREILSDFERVAVAFSGGVDSALLLAAATEALGAERVLAVTAHSELTPQVEQERAAELAQRLGVRHEVVTLDVLDDPEIAANRPDRCYHCKGVIFTALRERARAVGIANLVHGANRDDTSDFRPGMRAAEELGVRAPLLEAGLTKADVREVSRQMGLPTWDLPSMACLASRVPYDVPLTAATLARVEAAEAAVRAALGTAPGAVPGTPQLRVRDHYPLARIEVPETELARLVEPEVRCEVVRRLEAVGYRYVALDLGGFRSGSMNETIEAASLRSSDTEEA